MSSDKVSTTAAVCGVGAAVVAALSYWIVSNNKNKNSSDDARKSEDKDDDIKLVLAKLEEMQHRLDDVEKKAQARVPRRRTADNKLTRSVKSKRSVTRHGHQPAAVDGEVDAFLGGAAPKEHEKDADSNANVVPPRYPDEEGEDALGKKPPHEIVTKPPQDQASRFLMRLDSSIHEHHDHHSTNKHGSVMNGTAAATTASEALTLNLRAPVPVVLISDPGQDLDDEMMFIMARHLVSLDLITLEGVVANLSPSFARARLTRGTLDLLGLHRVPVGIGTDGGDVKGKHSSDQFESTASSYIVHEDGEAARGLESGHRLLQRLYDAADDIEYVDIEDDADEDDKSIDICEEDDDEDELKYRHPKRGRRKMIRGGLTVVITSSMKDIAIFVRDNPTLFASKTREVVVMGGCKPVEIADSKTALAMASMMNTTNVDDASLGSHYSNMKVWSGLSKVECEPDSAHNNMFDQAASAFFYSQCQKMNITLTVVSRYAAYAAKMPRSVYDDLALTGSSIGWRLRNSQRASIDQLWQRACSLDPAVRKGLPPRCDRKWFINTFCGGDDDPSRCCADTAWDLVTGFMQYDTIALLAAIPAVREMYFDPFVMPPLQNVREVDICLDGVGQLRIEEGRVLDLSDASRLEDETTIATGSRKSGPKRRSSLTTGPDTDALSSSRTGRRRANRRNSCPGSVKRVMSPECPGAVKRAIARAQEDNKRVETPFESPGSNIPEAFDRGTRNLIGVSENEHNLKDPNLLVNLLKTGYRQGILCNHHTQPHIILHLQLRWDNLADTLLTCLMLRSLWDMRLASVLGVIVSIYPSDSKQSKRQPDDVSASTADEDEPADNTAPQDANTGNYKKRASDVTTETADSWEGSSKSTPDQSPSTLAALAETIRGTLASIGLAHVKFVVVSGKDMDEHKKMSTEAFLHLYESSPPIGVTLVLTATFTSVWPFAESHPDIFRNKTVRVVHTGGALVWPARWGWANAGDGEEGLDNGELTDEQILVPDPAAQNHRLDMPSARLFYKRAQALSVPMVILSRHVAKECCIPRNFFDVLGSHGGEVGLRIFNNEKNSLLKLWRCSCAPVGSAARGNLPERCDAKWYAETFCAGRTATDEEELWNNVEAINLYSPIALLAALPGETLRTYFQTMPFPVRSATHHVIGLTEEVPPRNVKEPSELRRLIVQSLLSASLANESEFGQEPPPMVPIRMDHEQRSRSSRNMRNGNLMNSVISTLSWASSKDLDEDDMWTFSEMARRELFSRTVAQTSKNAVLPKEKKRKFVVTESRIAATIGFIPPQSSDDEA